MTTQATPTVDTPRIPRIGEKVPDFTANSSKGPIKIADYKGKWLVFFSHPADFTPVCTTELSEFARRFPDFKKLNCELLGLSVDSVPSHIAWTRNIREKFGISIEYPVIADRDMKVARLFGMVHEPVSDTATVRAVFFIDPNQTIRALIYYPLQNGRSVDEILRVVQALQTTDSNQVSTPEGWRPGEDVIVPPPQTLEGADKRVNEPYKVVDWYFSKKKI